MNRAMPWLIAAAAAVAGGSVWKYRADVRQKDAVSQGRALVTKAWTEGQSVPLRGMQALVVNGSAVSGTVKLQAQVLTSRDGRMRIKYLTEPLSGVTVWEDDSRTYRYNPRRKRLTVAERPQSLKERAQERIQVLESYEVRVVKQEPVAGHLTTEVELRPRSGVGKWRELWIDPITGVILQDEQRSSDKKVERRTTFTSVTYLPPAEEPAPSEFQPPEELVRAYGTARPGDTSSKFTPEALAKLLGYPVKLPKWLPAGYTLRGAYQTPCSTDPHRQAARLIFSDGLSTITLLQCGHNNCFETGGKSGLTARFDTPDHSFLAIGDVPVTELRRVAESAAR